MPPLNAQEAAQRLIAGEQAATRPPSDAVAATERLIRRLAHELSGWFGSYGARALLTRALTDAQKSHPVLLSVRVGVPPAPALDGLAESARTHGGVAAVAGTADLVAALLELLARLIGDDLAAILVAQSVSAAAPERSAAGPDTVESALATDRPGHTPVYAQDASTGGRRDASTDAPPSASADALSVETRELPDDGTDRHILENER